jgi:hypothetical protein
MVGETVLCTRAHRARQQCGGCDGEDGHGGRHVRVGEMTVLVTTHTCAGHGGW